ncbi:helix-turn-helix domain-containing protein [Candidatus Saccharibacteria bacterium]|nr:helix-turn-helix domain-containing protein [Candidatus Saccharibacteria bacterium]
MNNQPAYYGILPANVRYSPDLRPMEKIMFTEITALSNKDGYCSASNSYFAELYEVDPKTVGRWIRNLEKHGFVEIDQDPLSGHNRRIIPRDKKVTPRDKIVTPPVQKDHPPRDKKVPHNTTRTILQDNINEVGDSSEPPPRPPKKPIRTKRFTPPTLDELTQAFKEKLREKKVSGADFIARREAEKFMNHYEANGWQVGRTKMKSWPHAVAGWINRMDNYKTNNHDNRQRHSNGQAITDEAAHAIIADVLANGF